MTLLNPAHERADTAKVNSHRRRSGQAETKRTWRERGSSAVEFALVAPLFFTLVFGVIEFGALLTNKISLANASRVGARYGSLASTNGGGAQTTALTAARSLTRCANPSATATYSGGSPNEVTTTITCTYSALTPFGRLVTGLILPTTLTATTKMVVES